MQYHKYAVTCSRVSYRVGQVQDGRVYRLCVCVYVPLLCALCRHYGDVAFWFSLVPSLVPSRVPLLVPALISPLVNPGCFLVTSGSPLVLSLIPSLVPSLVPSLAPSGSLTRKRARTRSQIRIRTRTRTRTRNRTRIIQTETQASWMYSCCSGVLQ